MVGLDSLNPPQREAVRFVEGPMLILAGAGTGKTRVITFRIAYLISKGVKPENILAVTFTNKAAREMKERVRELTRGLGEGSGRRTPKISTFHSLCCRILRRDIEHLGYKKNFVIYDQGDQLTVVKGLLSRMMGGKKGVDAYEVLGLIGKLKNGAELGGDLGELAERLKRGYEEQLRGMNAVDFEDLILLVLRLFREHPEVLKRYQEEFLYVMVDEYQDTNLAQFEVVRLLAGGHGRFCAVGDDDQSIYGWRGAALGNLLDLETFFPGLRVVKLEQNYRSTNTILKAANAVIQRNSRRRSKVLWSTNGEGDPILVEEHGDEVSEAKSVVERIEGDKLFRQVPWSDHAILFRTNAQSRVFETHLRASGIRYRVVGGQSFFDRREIRDLMAFLKFFFNREDDLSLLRIANLPPRGLSAKTMEWLIGASQGQEVSVYSFMKHFEMNRAGVQGEGLGRAAAAAIGRFVVWAEGVERVMTGEDSAALEVRGGKWSEWVVGVLDEIGYFAELRRLEKDPEDGENRVKNVKEMLLGLDEIPGGGGGRDRVGTFLEELALDDVKRDQGRGEEDEVRDEVTLMTLHGCKGLEFPFVHLVGMEQGILPHTRSLEEGNLEEERRLFYVAITRARKLLRMSFCVQRKKYGGMSPCHPSVFLSELPPDLVVFEDPSAKRVISKVEGKGLFDSMRDALS